MKIEGGYAVAYVTEKTAERAPSFEEARERVGKDYLREKEAEVQSTLVKEIFQKHQVSVATEVFLPGAATKAEGEKKEPEKKDANKKEAEKK